VKRALVMAAVLAAAACQRKSAPPSADAAAVRSTEEVLGAVLPGVVLLVNRHDDGQIGFGAGIVLDDDGEVLTNLHVAGGGSLGALTYDPKRVSYIPQDGGLGRYLYENDDKIVHARLMRGDPTLDLALVKLDVPTKGAKLKLRAEPVKQGERVMAVGHPGETVWSFTSGVVSSLHQGMIQTDAAINRGNSGGPLIDAEGRVVGVNTSKLVGDMHGIGFARPIDIAKPLIDGHGQVAVLDRSTPERAMKTCWAAVELGSETFLDCFDWEGLYDFTQESLRRRIKLLNLKGAAKADYERRVSVISKDEMIGAMKAAQLALLRGDDPRESVRDLQHRIAQVDMVDGAAEAYKKGFAKAPTPAKLKQRLEAPDGGIAQYERDFDHALFDRTGMKIDTSNPRAMFELIKLGRRIDKSATVDDTHAFVAIRGRNHDGTEYRASTFLAKQPSGWVIVLYPLPKEEALRPPDFPNLETSYEEDLTRLVKLEAEMYQPLKPTKKPR
jgi:hypothetical protein